MLKLLKNRCSFCSKPVDKTQWRVTVSSVSELLELQGGLGAPVLLEGGRLMVMAEGA